MTRCATYPVARCDASRSPARSDIKSRADILGYVRRLVAKDGVSVLWATHLIDEVSDDDDVIVLHQGRVLVHGSVSRIRNAADAQDIRTAFTRLTQGADAASEAP